MKLKIGTEVLAGLGVLVLGFFSYKRYESIKPGDTVTVPYSYGNVTYKMTYRVTSVDSSSNTFTGQVVDSGGLPTTFLPPASVPLDQATNTTPRLW